MNPLLPFKRISWSSLSTWEKSKKEFHKRYILKEPMFETKELRFGKWFAEEIEKPFSENETIELIRPLIGGYKIPEYKAIKQIETPIGIVEAISYLDAYDPGIGEYKTGKTPWTQDRVNKHGQLDFYNFMTDGPRETNLYWIQTENDENGNIKLTGNVTKFNRIITEEDIKNIESRIIKATVDINEYYKQLIEDTF